MEMSDTKTNDRKINSKFCSRTLVIVVGANILLSCMICIMVILLFSGQKTSNEPLHESMLDESDRKILEQFIGHFRTQEQQDMLERRNRRDILPISDTIYPANCTPSQEKPYTIPWCTLHPSEVNLHACCKSTPKYVSPAYVIDIYGFNRTLAVFGSSKQFFRIEKCSQLGECNWCTCKTEKVLYSGVYEEKDDKSDSKYGVTFFKLDGCCRCYS